MAIKATIKSLLANLLLKGTRQWWMPEWVTYHWITPTFQHLAMEGYRANGVVFACVSALVDGFVEAPLRLYEREGTNLLRTVERDPLVHLLENPNSQMSQSEFLSYVMLYTAIGGNCYLQKLRSRAGLVGELIPYSDADITPIQWRGPFVDHYEYVDPEGQTRTISRDDIIHLKWMPDPLKPYTGIAPIMAAAREVDTDTEAARYIYTMLKNDAVPRLVLVRPPNVPPLTDEQFRRNQEQWIERYGEGRRGRPAILEAGTQVQELSMTLDKLALDTLRGIPETRICAVYRVHPVLIGLKTGLQASTYNNYEEVRLAFTEHTLYPLWRRFADEIRQGLASDFHLSPNRVLAFDTSNVAALGVRQRELWERIDRGVVHRYVMVSEARMALGLSPIPGTDRFLEPAASGLAQAAPPAERKALLSYDITDEDVDAAIRRWDEVMPSLYAGLLEAEVEE